MSIISILFGTRAPESAVIGGIEMDVTLEETHSRDAQVTENPVESGATVADHVVLEPEGVSIEGFISSAPVRILPLGQAGTGRVLDAFEELDRLWRRREPVELVTGYRVYDDMIITRLELPRRREVGLRFTAELRKVNIVDSEVAELPALDEVSDAAAQEQNRGRQSTREASESTEGQSSFLIQSWDFAVEAFDR